MFTAQRDLVEFDVGDREELCEQLLAARTSYVSFGAGPKWVWGSRDDSDGDSESWSWRYGGLTNNQHAFIQRIVKNHGNNLKIFLGAEDAMVLISGDSNVSFVGCARAIACNRAHRR